MQQELLPLFPLQLVLLPRTLLPLHIFEERYKKMLREVMGKESEFGVVQVSGEGIVPVGCSATVEKLLKQYSDGRMDLIAVGRRRFEVVGLDQDEEFLRGSVRFFDDEQQSDIAPELQRRVLASYADLLRVEQPRGMAEPNLEDPQLSFQLGQLIDELDFRQALLSLRSEAERLDLLANYLERLIPQKRETQHLRAVAPRNGHGKKWPSSI